MQIEDYLYEKDIQEPILGVKLDTMTTEEWKLKDCHAVGLICWRCQGTKESAIGNGPYSRLGTISSFFISSTKISLVRCLALCSNNSLFI